MAAPLPAVEALLWLIVARLAIIVLPFRRIASHLGVLVPPERAKQHIAGSIGRGEEAAPARLIGWAVHRMAAHVPFRAVCLERAVAAKIMLRRRGIRSLLYFGVAPGRVPEKKLVGHAWLDAADVHVTGYEAAKTVTMIACFF